MTSEYQIESLLHQRKILMDSIVSIGKNLNIVREDFEISDYELDGSVVLMIAVDILQYKHHDAERGVSDEKLIEIACSSGIIDCLNDPYDAQKNGDDNSSIPVDLVRFYRLVEKKLCQS